MKNYSDRIAQEAFDKIWNSLDRENSIITNIILEQVYDKLEKFNYSELILDEML